MGFKFTFQDGQEYTVTLEGRNINEEDLFTFEKCSGDWKAVQSFKIWLNTFVNRVTLSEFIKDRSE